MENVAAFREYFSLTQLEKLLICPPTEKHAIHSVVKRFEVLQGKVTEEGEDLLAHTLVHCPQLLMLLAYLRYADYTSRATKHNEMHCLRQRFLPLARGFRYSASAFACAIRENNHPGEGL